LNKKLLSFLVCIGIWFFIDFGTSSRVHADVVDEVMTKSAQNDFIGDAQLVKSYKGEKSGVTFESYSSEWSTTEQLKAIEEELLRNKHGEELAYLGKVIIIPNNTPGSGSYRSLYSYWGNSMELMGGREIYLFGGDKVKTVQEYARTISHEYGHHFTYFQMINREKLLPGNWQKSEYVANRGIKSDSRINYTQTGEWQWMIQEIMAEDYVQLFGSKNALKNGSHRNSLIPTPFEVPTMQEYWTKYLSGYSPKSNLSIYLEDYKVAITSGEDQYNLLILIKNRQNNPTYLLGQPISQTISYSTLIDEVPGGTESSKWYKYLDLPSSTKRILNRQLSPEIRITAIQHETTGFNRGSKPLTINYNNVSASVSSVEDVNSDNYKDSKVYSNTEIKTMLHEVALQNGIPPEILKAIAFVETGMQQFDATTGNPIIAADGGIGMMQITMSDEQLLAQGIDKEMLKWNTRYNIEMGAKILKEKWNNPNLPKINDKNPDTIENWYFAIMAYNGLSKRNDPTRPQEQRPYQERVLEAIRNNALLPISTIPSVTISYPNPAAPDLMAFPVQEYNWPTVGLKSTQMWKPGQTVYTLNNQLTYSKLRDDVNGAEIKQLPHYTPLEIVSGPYEVDNVNNHYVMYEVSNNGTIGYIASSNLRGGNLTLFEDVQIGESASAIAYLQLKNLIDGLASDSFFKPNTPILRVEAASMLVKELGLTLPAGYKMKATDMKPTDANYEEMMIAEAHGILGKDGTIRPNGHLTRAQMAAILVRAYEMLYTKPTTSVSFTDVKKTDWSFNDINTLAFNKITVTANGPYRPNGEVTRSQFALFLTRTMELRK
jgi:hypothetical protein